MSRATSLERNLRRSLPGMLALLFGCGEGLEPLADEATVVLSLNRDGSRIEAVEGDIAAFDVASTVRLSDPDFRPSFNGTGVIELPWPAVAGTLRLETASGEILTAVDEPWNVARENGFTTFARLERLPAVELRSFLGRRIRGSPGSKRPFQLWLEKEGDYLEHAAPWPVERVDYRLFASAAGGPVEVAVLVDGEERSLLTVEGAAWKPYAVSLQADTGRHTVRFVARGAPTPGKKHLVALLAIEKELQSGDLVLARREALAGLQLSYVARAPELEETLHLRGSSPHAVSLLAAGGPLEVTADGDATFALDGKVPAGAGASGFTLDPVAPGLHHLTVHGDARSLRVTQPLAALLRSATSLQQRDRDHPADDGARPSAGIPAALLDRLLARMTVQRDRRVGFWLPAPSRVRCRVSVQAGDHLRFATGISEPPPRTLEEEETPPEVPEGRVRFRVLWQRGEETRTLLDVEQESAVPWREHEVVLDAADAGQGEITFETRLVAGPRGLAAGVAEPRLVRRHTQPRRPNVILYLIDTLRADRLSCYGAERDNSPFLRELAADGFVFQRFASVASWTRPTTASLLTGLYPAWHGVNAAHTLSFGPVTLAEVLRHEGYSTWAIACNPHVISHGMNFDQGFQRFLGIERSHELAVETSSEQMHAALLPWLQSCGDEPFFLYLHSMDPHSPYQTSRKLKDPYGTDYRGPLRDVPLFPHGALEGKELDAADVQYVKDIYDNEVRYQDQQLRRLRDDLRALGLLDHTVLVIVADHGEEFHEHGGWAHGQRMWKELLQVPLIVWLPPSLRSRLHLEPRVVTEPTSQVDLAPGLLDLLDMQDPYPRQGHSFRPLLYRPGDERPLYSEEIQVGDADDLGALQDGTWKLVWERDRDADEIRFRLYDLATDPGEQNDVATGQPETVLRLRDLRDRLREDHALIQQRLTAAGLAPLRGGVPLQLTESAASALRELGYVVDEPGEER